MVLVATNMEGKYVCASTPMSPDISGIKAR
jgi:hypothetical protein